LVIRKVRVTKEIQKSDFARSLPFRGRKKAKKSEGCPQGVVAQGGILSQVIVLYRCSISRKKGEGFRQYLGINLEGALHPLLTKENGVLLSRKHGGKKKRHTSESPPINQKKRKKGGT